MIAPGVVLLVGGVHRGQCVEGQNNGIVLIHQRYDPPTRRTCLYNGVALTWSDPFVALVLVGD